MHRSVSFLFLLLVACGSSAPVRPASIVQPGIAVELSDRPFFGSGDRAPVEVVVTVLNRAAEPITIRRVEVDSPGMTQYAIRRVTRDFHEVVAPGEEKTVSVTTMAITTVQRPSEPLTLRAVVTFRAAEATWREMLISH